MKASTLVHSREPTREVIGRNLGLHDETLDAWRQQWRAFDALRGDKLTRLEDSLRLQHAGFELRSRGSEVSMAGG